MQAEKTCNDPGQMMISYKYLYYITETMFYLSWIKIQIGIKTSEIVASDMA